MDFVEEENDRLSSFLGVFDDLSDVVFAGRDGGELVEIGVDGVGVNTGNGGFACTWRTLENKRKYMFAFDG